MTGAPKLQNVQPTAPENPVNGAASLPPDSDGASRGGKKPEGLLITFEGGEGSGKTTQAIRLYLKLSNLGVPVMLAREPGSTRLGDHVRNWVKDQSDTTPLAETLLFAAARAQLIEEGVRPALKDGRVVILDRFVDSTLAYQGYGRGFDIQTIKVLNALVTGGLNPALTVLLDIGPVSALKRLGLAGQPLLNVAEADSKIRLDPPDQRRFEKESVQFHERVLRGYRELANEDKGRWAVIQAQQPRHRIADAIWKRVRTLLMSQFTWRYERLLEQRGGYRFSSRDEAGTPSSVDRIWMANSW